MQSTNSEYGSPYLAVCHVTFTFTGRVNHSDLLHNTETNPIQTCDLPKLEFLILFIFLIKTNINSDEGQNITFHGWIFTGVIYYFIEEALNDHFHLIWS